MAESSLQQLSEHYGEHDRYERMHDDNVYFYQ